MANLYNVPLKNAVQKVLANTLLTSETGTITFTTSVTSDLQASSTIPGILVIDRIDVNGNLTPSLTEYISFEAVSGSTVTSLTRGLGGTVAQDHAIGAVVEFVPDVVWADAINDVFIEQHNADGTHKTLANISLASVTISNSIITNTSFSGNSLASVTIYDSKFDGLTINNTTISNSSLASTTLTNRTYIQSRSVSKAVISLASSTYNISIQNANVFDLQLNGSSKSLAVNDVFADSSMTSPFIIKVIYGGTCSLTFQNTIRWAGGSAPTQTGASGKADVFGFIPSTASIFDGFVVGLNHTV